MQNLQSICEALQIIIAAATTTTTVTVPTVPSLLGMMNSPTIHILHNRITMNMGCCRENDHDEDPNMANVILL